MSGPLKALGSIQEGNAAYAAGSYSNAVAQQNAQQTQAQGEEEGSRIRAQARATMGEAIAAQGGAGFQVGTGSNLEALRESAINGELDVLTTRHKAQLTADSQRSSGALELMKGKAARTAGYIGAATAIATSAEKAATGGAGGGG